MAAVDDLETLPAPVLAVNSAKAADVVQLRGDESPVPAMRLFKAIAPAASAGGTALPGDPTDIRLTATLSRSTVGAASLVLTVTDAARRLPASRAGHPARRRTAAPAHRAPRRPRFRLPAADRPGHRHVRAASAAVLAPGDADDRGGLVYRLGRRRRRTGARLSGHPVRPVRQSAAGEPGRRRRGSDRVVQLGLRVHHVGERPGAERDLSGGGTGHADGGTPDPDRPAGHRDAGVR